MLFMPDISMVKYGTDNRFNPPPFFYRIPKCRATIKLLHDLSSTHPIFLNSVCRKTSVAFGISLTPLLNVI
ncbi:MAG: hypothetical protein LUQ56_10205, partial [Methylococcaceae bacterium]|nr:hypothetical protein [Methylococcaceae bacterium]MDD1642959.1 hypothetical protein [Methylococcaceae bacterium]